MSSANAPRAARAGREELAAIRNDPDIQRLARQRAGDLAEDVLQEAYYAVARAQERVSIDNLRGYFYRTLVNTARRMQQELARGPVPVDDPDAAAGAACRGRPRRDTAAAPSAESDALTRICFRMRRELLRQSRASLRAMIPACSDDPRRYREAILAVAESVVTGGGPASQAEINDALATAYPEWFEASGCRPATLHQRRCRARESIRVLLTAVIDRDDLLP